MTTNYVPRPDDSEPRESLTLDKVQILGPKDAEEIMKNTIILAFNRPLTWWESEAAVRMMVNVEPGQAHATYRFDITRDQAFPELRALVEKIRSAATASRQVFLERYEALRHAERQINEGLERYPF